MEGERMRSDIREREKVSERVCALLGLHFTSHPNGFSHPMIQTIPGTGVVTGSLLDPVMKLKSWATGSAWRQITRRPASTLSYFRRMIGRGRGNSRRVRKNRGGRRRTEGGSQITGWQTRATSRTARRRKKKSKAKITQKGKKRKEKNARW